jgi:hypothetical protein
MEAPRSTSTVRSADTYGIAIASGAVSGRRVTKNENGFRAASSPTGRSLGRHYKIPGYGCITKYGWIYLTNSE